MEVKIQFPKDDNNEIYDGRIHTVSPVELESTSIRNNKLYMKKINLASHYLEIKMEDFLKFP